MSSLKSRPTYLFQWPVIHHGHRTAIVYKEERLTFAQADARINRFSHGLLSLGLTVGQKVAVLLNNSLEAIDAILGIPRAGLVYISLNARHSLREHINILNDVEADAIVYGEEFADFLEPGLSSVPSLSHRIVAGRERSGSVNVEQLVSGQSENLPDIEVHEEDIVRIQYTSGTTGKPKGIVWSFRIFENVLTSTLINMDRSIEPDDVNLNSGPLTHAAGLMLMSYYCRGATNIVLPGFEEQKILQTIEDERVSSILLIPTMFYRILKSPDLKKYDTSSIKRIWYGTAPMSVDRLKEGIRVFGPVFRQNYGMTEVPQPITLLPPEDHIIDETETRTTRLSSAGRPAMGVELKIVDEQDREVGTDEIGEILIRSNKMMKEYWKQPDESAKTLQGGWVHTRDMGRVDRDGYLYIMDRKSDMIISGGFNIYPREVEEVIAAHPDVVEAAVFAIPDDTWGETVKAVVVPKTGQKPAAEEIIRHCRENLASYKKPTQVDFADEIPKNPYGKVDRKKLKDRYWRNANRGVH